MFKLLSKFFCKWSAAIVISMRRTYGINISRVRSVTTTQIFIVIFKNIHIVFLILLNVNVFTNIPFQYRMTKTVFKRYLNSLQAELCLYLQIILFFEVLMGTIKYGLICSDHGGVYSH